ncbi:ABR084Wp [Eremothecium gossypii ATCC 10895]|uniref:ABR084Wp n=1 Tax=Eremothecium gossypii (strain ATCC 10895 / CBS 109.51 / FGSC 9923 / NRRL Y-1056) TaxID=284811 RepID=Q75DE3_EREGS|nr:ABR084Wp [Eremothecium gossypii ATCC 10895]AAS50854.1 ABR084Wp [Eremothecium gossypii ATCC 10895]AEY95143.1 FABR084Wp [Eremothecium gossypii FDAG1]
MAPLRQDSYFLIYPRSRTTLVQFGIGEETFVPPSWEVPTRVYRDEEGQLTSFESAEVVYPIVDGRIADLDGLLYFLKLIYKSILSHWIAEHPDTWEAHASNIPMLLLTHYSWSQREQELITQYVFEEMRLNHFMVVPAALSISYAFGSIQNCLVIDIGATHTDIVPIVDYVPLDYMAYSAPIGGDDINAKLATLLPGWSPEQIEDLKKSPIFEVLSKDAKDQSRFNFDDDAADGEDNDEGTLDVAAIVTSGRDTREILEERERNKNKEQVSNSQLETNVFADRTGKQINVGKQRFQGCDDLLKGISQACGMVLAQIDEIPKNRAIWENILIAGATSEITGFREALLTQLCEDNLVLEPEGEKHQREQDMMASMPKQRKNKYIGSASVSGGFLTSLEYLQSPTIIKSPKFPDYFTEWKKHGYGEVAFLGAQIVSKQVFGHSNDSFFMTRDKYDEKGPAIIWDVCF